MVTLFPLSTFRKTARAVLLAACVFAGAAPALAQQHRVRFGSDLVDHIRTGSAAVEVIIEGDRTTVDRVARQYNLVVKRYMKNGGVLLANSDQLAALQTDAELDHLSGNVQYRTLAVDPLDQGIGADQVWAGVGVLPKLSG